MSFECSLSGEAGGEAEKKRATHDPNLYLQHPLTQNREHRRTQGVQKSRNPCNTGLGGNSSFALALIIIVYVLALANRGSGMPDYKNFDPILFVITNTCICCVVIIL